MNYKQTAKKFVMLIMKNKTQEAFDNYVWEWFLFNHQFGNMGKEECITTLVWLHKRFPKAKFIIDDIDGWDWVIVLTLLIQLYREHKGSKLMFTIEFENKKIIAINKITLADGLTFK